MDWSAAMAVAETQRGVLTRTQLLQSGLSRSTVRRAIDDGLLIRVIQGIYRFSTTPNSWEVRAMAGVLSAGSDAVLSHASAAALWNLPDFKRSQDDDVHLSIANRRGIELAHGYVVHRPKRQYTPYRLHTFPVTRLGRTFFDLAAELNEERLEICLDAAHHRFRNLQRWLDEELRGLDPRRYAGLPTLQKLLAVRKGVHTESPLETRLRRAMREHHLPEPTWQLNLFDADGFIMRVDAAFESHLIAVHGDSWQWHSGRQRFDTDAAQRRRLAALGWVSIAVTKTDLESDTWVTSLLELLDQRKPQHDLFIRAFIPRSNARPGSSLPAR